MQRLGEFEACVSKSGQDGGRLCKRSGGRLREVASNFKRSGYWLLEVELDFRRSGLQPRRNELSDQGF